MIDAADADLVGAYNWHSFYGKTGRKSGVYVRGKVNGTAITIHRFLLGASKRSIQVDHINGQTLTNCRFNLRIATPAQNAWNCGARSTNNMGIKGISFVKGRSGCGVYMARITA